MALNHSGPFETAELIENVRAWAHTANAVALPDGGLFLVWSAGQFEGAEDMVVAGARMDKDGKWGKAHVVVDRFDLNGETWIPWCPTVLQAADGSLHVFFMGNPRSGHVFCPYPVSTVRAAWMLGDDRANRMFHARLRDFKCEKVEMLLPEEQGVNTQGRPLHLRSGGWAVPFDSMTTQHQHFLILDEQVRFVEKRGDLFCPPGSLEPSVVQLPDGDVICYLRYCPRDGDWYGGLVKDAKTPHGHVWKTVSHDECRTFSEPVSTNLRNPNAGIDIALSRSSGRFLITYNDSYTLRLPLCVGISDDLGRTFRVRDVEAGLAEPYYAWPFANYMRNCHAYPKLIQTPNGIWHLFYSHRMECIKHVWFEEAALEGGRKVMGLDD